MNLKLRRFGLLVCLLSSRSAFGHGTDVLAVLLLPWIVGWLLVHGLVITVLVARGSFVSRIWLALSLAFSIVSVCAALIGISIMTGQSLNGVGEVFLAAAVGGLWLTLTALPIFQYRKLRRAGSVPKTPDDAVVAQASESEI